MTSGKPISVQTIGRIRQMWLSNVPIRHIADALSINKSTVENVLKNKIADEKKRPASSPPIEGTLRELEMLREAVADAWGVIANAHGGEWADGSDDWQLAATRWRDKYVNHRPARINGTPNPPPARTTKKTTRKKKTATRKKKTANRLER